jgi:hypothetical protein
MHDLLILVIKGLAGGMLVVAFALLSHLADGVVLALATVVWIVACRLGYLVLWWR